MKQSWEWSCGKLQHRNDDGRAWCWRRKLELELKERWRDDPKGLSVRLGKRGLCSEFCFMGISQAGICLIQFAFWQAQDPEAGKD